MRTLARLSVLLLPLLLAACQPDEPLRGSFRCADQSQFRYNRQSQTVELNRGGASFHGFMDEKRQMVWPKNEGDRSLPDTYALSRKVAGQLMLYGGFAGKGLACHSDAATTAQQP
ncbi:hypothetical protein ACFPAG_08100 [Vogesella sp. GCM10023246]|uniref:C-type lysozyme inhibitor domain-containing protein n=1 Tax=Vogesella oryzagri TaxID=3160864 RepID=A0ABV1M357_9NEIS